MVACPAKVSEYEIDVISSYASASGSFLWIFNRARE